MQIGNSAKLANVRQPVVVSPVKPVTTISLCLAQTILPSSPWTVNLRRYATQER